MDFSLLTDEMINNMNPKQLEILFRKLSKNLLEKTKKETDEEIKLLNDKDTILQNILMDDSLKLTSEFIFKEVQKIKNKTDYYKKCLETFDKIIIQGKMLNDELVLEIIDFCTYNIKTSIIILKTFREQFIYIANFRLKWESRSRETFEDYEKIMKGEFEILKEFTRLKEQVMFDKITEYGEKIKNLKKKYSN